VFSLCPSSVEFLLKMEAAVGKITGAAGSPNLLLQVNGAHCTRMCSWGVVHGGGRVCE